MLSSSMPEALRKEKNYYDVSGCGANIAWHTENDTIEIADRDILLKDMRIYLLSALRIANAEILPFDWVATCDEFLATIDSYETQSNGLADLSAARAVAAELPSFSAEMRRFGAVELMRGMNRYIAAIDAATRLVEGVPA